MKKILSLIVISLLCFSQIVACSKDNSSGTEEGSLNIVKNGSSDYTIVRSENSSSVITVAAQSLQNAIKDTYGVVCEIVLDSDKAVTDGDGSKELLVGETNRSESEAVLGSFSGGQFAVKVSTSKLVLLGETENGTVKAVNYFIENYIKKDSSGGKILTLAKDVSYLENFDIMYVYYLQAGSSFYDQALATSCLQGIFNREDEKMLYVMNATDSNTNYWLKKMQSEGNWLEKYETRRIKSFVELLSITKKYVKEVIIWDTDVPATMNVATTMAGIEDGIVLSSDLYESIKSEISDLPVVDLRGKFDGSVTGSAKNDAYRWAIDKYLKTGQCSKDYLCLYEDSATARKSQTVAYVVTRDWAVYNRAFVYDLSPWGDEAPGDDTKQKIGTDLATYKMMLEAQLAQTNGEQMTEIAGFFSFTKYAQTGGTSKHEDVATEWESVYLMSEYNCFQNTVADSCYNQSVHSQYEVTQLTQNDYQTANNDIKLEKKTYISFFMADYDSATPLYSFLRKYWDDPNRGKIPLAWGINPNLIESYPDLFQYFYNTRTDNDTFTADASAAGYFNPSRILDKYWNMVVEHNKKYFTMADMSIAPMVLDWGPLSDTVKSNLIKFAPDGISTIVLDFHKTNARGEYPHVYNDTLVCSLDNSFDRSSTDASAASLAAALRSKGASEGNTTFLLSRVVWLSPTHVVDTIKKLRELRPDLDIEIIDIYSFYRLQKGYLDS